jgi:hypothetical protein
MSRIKILDVLNNPRILKSIDDNQIELPDNLRACVTQTQDECARFILKYFNYYYFKKKIK